MRVLRPRDEVMKEYQKRLLDNLIPNRVFVGSDGQMFEVFHLPKKRLWNIDCLLSNAQDYLEVTMHETRPHANSLD